MFVSLGFLPKITLPKRFSKKHCTIIDQIYCKFKNFDTRCESGVLITAISDHFPCVTTFEIPPQVKTKKKYVTYLDKSQKKKH